VSMLVNRMVCSCYSHYDNHCDKRFACTSLRVRAWSITHMCSHTCV